MTGPSKLTPPLLPPHSTFPHSLTLPEHTGHEREASARPPCSAPPSTCTHTGSSASPLPDSPGTARARTSSANFSGLEASSDEELHCWVTFQAFPTSTFLPPSIPLWFLFCLHFLLVTEHKLLARMGQVLGVHHRTILTHSFSIEAYSLVIETDIKQIII